MSSHFCSINCIPFVNNILPHFSFNIQFPFPGINRQIGICNSNKSAKVCQRGKHLRHTQSESLNLNIYKKSVNTFFTSINSVIAPTWNTFISQIYTILLFRRKHVFCRIIKPAFFFNNYISGCNYYCPSYHLQ